MTGVFLRKRMTIQRQHVREKFVRKIPLNNHNAYCAGMDLPNFKYSLSISTQTSFTQQERTNKEKQFIYNDRLPLFTNPHKAIYYSIQNNFWHKDN